jgi:hypothetical protein
MEHGVKTHFIPDKLTVKMGNNGRQHPPKLKLFLEFVILFTLFF